MTLEFFLLLFFYFSITIAVIGYGLLFSKIFSVENSLNIGLYGLYGLFFLIIYSYLSHVFIAHGKVHNLIILIIGVIFFLLYFHTKINKKELFITFVNFSILFIGLLIFKTHDDFPYYHFPYSYYITQEPMLVGIGQFNHGFRTPSSIFYLNSMFYLPFIKYFSFYIPSLIIMGFANQIFLSNIFHHIKEKEINFLYYLNILLILFFCIFFYRVQEHGTDRSAQLLIGILFLQFLYFLKFDNQSEFRINHLLIILGIIVSLKAFYLIYLIFILPLFIILFRENKKELFIKFFQNKFFLLFVLLVFLVIFVYFINTGCLLYPASFTCFENFSWSLGVEQADKMYQHYQLWSKAGMTPNFLVDNPSDYLKNFNWLSNWLNIYFFNKVSDFVLGITTLCFIVFIFFFKKIENNSKNFKNKNIFLIYFFLLILIAEWFFNHPALRYGGYILFALVIFIPLSLKLEKYNNSIDEVKKKQQFY